MGRNRYALVLSCLGIALAVAVSFGGVVAADQGAEPSLSGASTPEEATDTAADQASNATRHDDAGLRAAVPNATGATPADLSETANETLGVPDVLLENVTNETAYHNGSADPNDRIDSGGVPGVDLGFFPEDGPQRSQGRSEPFGGLSGQSQGGTHWSDPTARDPSVGVSGRRTAGSIREADGTGSSDGSAAPGEDTLEVSLDGGGADTTSSDANPGRTDGAGAVGGAQTASLGWFGLEGVFAAGPPLFVALLVLALKPFLGGASVLTTAVFDLLSRIGVVLRYSRRDDSDPLEHETRADIYDTLTSDPGTTLPDLSDRLETPLSTVRYHVQVLEREGLISSQKQRGNRRFYPVGVENETLAAALQTDTAADIVRSLADRGAATVGDLVDDIEKSYSTVSHHISRLAEDDIIVREKEGRQRVCRLTPGARTALSDGQKPAPETETSTATAD